MPVYRLTASSIISSFRGSGKRHLLLTGGRGTGKTPLLRALVPLLCPGAQEITTAAYPADRVEIRESVGGKIAVIGRFDPALPPGESRMRPVADGFLLLGLYYSLRSGFFQVFECRLWLRATLGSLLVPDWTQIVAPLSCLADFTFNFLGTKKP